MKAARLVVLGVAVAAGGLAALLAGRSGEKPAPAPEPVVQFETVDVLVASHDLSAGSTLKPDDLRWQPALRVALGHLAVRRLHALLSERWQVGDVVIGGTDGAQNDWAYQVAEMLGEREARVKPLAVRRGHGWVRAEGDWAEEQRLRL